MRPLSHSRGSALLIAMIAMAVLALLVAGAISFSGTNRQAAAASNRADATAACADAARRHLLSRLRTFNVNVGAIELDTKLADSATEGDRSRIMTGHFGDDDPTPTIVAVNAAQFSGAARQVRDIANSAPGTGTLGGNYYRVVVKCAQPGNREAELEFVFRHGI